MDQNWEQHRTHQRVFFSHKAGLTALLSLPGLRSAIPSKIVDLSLGGMACTMLRHQNLIFHEKDLLNLVEFYNLERKRITANISMEIRWVLDAENFNNIGLGFRFIDPADTMKQALRAFIDQGLNAQHIGIQKTDTQAFVKKEIQVKVKTDD
jgi:c-di-GMP-binding flagellar brake protein YcgR